MSKKIIDWETFWKAVHQELSCMSTNRPSICDACMMRWQKPDPADCPIWQGLEDVPSQTVELKADDPAFAMPKDPKIDLVVVYEDEENGRPMAYVEKDDKGHWRWRDIQTLDHPTSFIWDKKTRKVTREG